jgi:hypothetical protein
MCHVPTLILEKVCHVHSPVYPGLTPRVDAPLRPHIIQTNPPITFSASPRSCTTDPYVLFLTGAPPPSPAPPPALCHHWRVASVHHFPPKATSRCGLFPSCFSHLRPSPPTALVAGIWPAVTIPLHKGTFCFDFNISKKISVKSQGHICKPETRTLKTNL